MARGERRKLYRQEKVGHRPSSTVLDVMLLLKVMVRYEGQPTSRQSIARAICPDRILEIENDVEIIGMADLKLNSAEIVPLPDAKTLHAERKYFLTGKPTLIGRPRKDNGSLSID